MNLNGQLIFDIVATHLLTQKAKSVNKYGACMYRGLNGLKCAAGALISDEEYDPKMENMGISGVISRFGLYWNMDYADQHFVSRLQHIHDLYAVQDWKAELYSFANYHNLNNSVLSKF